MIELLWRWCLRQLLHPLHLHQKRSSCRRQSTQRRAPSSQTQSRIATLHLEWCSTRRERTCRNWPFSERNENFASSNVCIGLSFLLAPISCVRWLLVRQQPSLVQRPKRGRLSHPQCIPIQLLIAVVGLSYLSPLVGVLLGSLYSGLIGDRVIPYLAGATKASSKPNTSSGSSPPP